MNTQQVIDLYNKSWAETDKAARAALLEQAWSDDGTYTDPTVAVAGREGLTAVIEHMQGQYPGCAIQQTGPLEEHHGTAYFTWDFTVGGVPAVSGRDFVQLADDGRIKSITGFYPMPEG